MLVTQTRKPQVGRPRNPGPSYPRLSFIRSRPAGNKAILPTLLTPHGTSISSLKHRISETVSQWLRKKTAPSRNTETCSDLADDVCEFLVYLAGHVKPYQQHQQQPQPQNNMTIIITATATETTIITSTTTITLTATLTMIRQMPTAITTTVTITTTQLQR